MATDIVRLWERSLAVGPLSFQPLVSDFRSGAIKQRRMEPMTTENGDEFADESPGPLSASAESASLRTYNRKRREHLGRLLGDFDRQMQSSLVDVDQAVSIMGLVAREAALIAESLRGVDVETARKAGVLDEPPGDRWNPDVFSASPAEPVDMSWYQPTRVERLHSRFYDHARVELLVRPSAWESAIRALVAGNRNGVNAGRAPIFNDWALLAADTSIPRLYRRRPRRQFAALACRIGGPLERAGLAYRVTHVEVNGIDYLEPVPLDFSEPTS